MRYELPNTVAIKVPSTMGLSEPIDNTPYVEWITDEMTRMFGGCDAIPTGYGKYLADSGEIIKELTVLCESNTSELSDEDIENFIKLALELKAKLKQESIYYRINGIAYIE